MTVNYRIILSEKNRIVFYSLPFLLQWVIGITWEKEQRVLNSARRSMALFLLLMTATFILAIVSSTLGEFLPGIEFFRQLTNSVIQSAIGTAYLVISFFLAYAGFTGKDNTAVGLKLDAIAEKIEKLLHN